MKLIGLLVSLAILGYAASIYLKSSKLSTASPDGSQSRPKDYLDDAQKSADAMKKSLQEQQERMNNSN